jgi:hypothetical protein
MQAPLRERQGRFPHRRAIGAGRRPLIIVGRVGEAEVTVAHQNRTDLKIAVIASVFAMITAFTLASMPRAYAHYFGPLYADNPSQSYYYDAGHTAGARAATTWTIEYSYQPTHMTWYYTTTDIHGSNDIWYTVDPLPDPYTGITDCRARQDPDECEHWHVTYDEPWWIAADDVPRRVLACHETGHTTGLKDGGTYGCMEQGQYWNQYLGTHNRDHINERY